MRLKGKHIVLTGGLGGIGSVLLNRLEAAGAKVTVVDRGEGENVIRADLSDPEAVNILCKKLPDMDVDILINLAGLMYFGNTEEQPAQSVSTLLQVNLETPVRLAQAVIPGMRRKGCGQIVNIGSVFGSLSFPHFTVYSATKAGLKSFSEGLRRELRGKGISVTYIAPRAVKTGLNSGPIAELHQRTRVVNDDPGHVAGIILDAIEKDKKDVYIGFPEAFFVRLNALLPRVVDGGLTAKRDIADEILKSGQRS